MIRPIKYAEMIDRFGLEPLTDIVKRATKVAVKTRPEGKQQGDCTFYGVVQLNELSTGKPFEISLDVYITYHIIQDRIDSKSKVLCMMIAEGSAMPDEFLDRYNELKEKAIQQGETPITLENVKDMDL